MGRIVLVTGVSNDLGRRVVPRLAADSRVERVIGVDVVPPRGDLGPATFVRADIRNPVIAKVIAGEGVDTVVHTSVVASSTQLGGRAAAKEHNVIGTMQLLAACQRAPGLERLVVKSSGQVYGASSRDPAMFTEDMAAHRLPRGGFLKDLLEVEGYVRGFARRRPDVTVTMVRNASAISSSVASPLGDYLRLDPVPKIAGFDARVQLLHHEDLVAVLHHAAFADVHGTFNVAGDGVLMLSQMIRRSGRRMVPVPAFVWGALGSVSTKGRPGMPDLAPEYLPFLTYGRCLDATRMRSVLGFEPAYTTEQALAEFTGTLSPGLLGTPPTRPPTKPSEPLATGAAGGRRG